MTQHNVDLVALVDRVKAADLPFPPPETDFTGGMGTDMYRAVGIGTLQSLVGEYGLKPEDRVLEIGSGLGRIAGPLTQYLTNGYVGVEIVERGVDWCRENISAACPDFEFIHLDYENEFYNPNGTARLARLPLDDASFDCVVFSSVFTHLVVEDAENYIRESARLLKPGGFLWGSWFLLLDGEEGETVKGPWTLFKDEVTFHANKPGATSAVVYQKDHVLSMISDAGVIFERLQPGTWCRDVIGGYQDLLVARKPG